MADGADYEVAVVGAGAAGLAAGRTLAAADKRFVVLEASHRTGGRGYTEELLPGVPFDLGCHWLHSASLNPFVAIADALGIAYSKEGFPPPAGFRDGSWYSDEDLADWAAYYERQEEAMRAAAASGEDRSVYEATDRDARWSRIYDHFLSVYTSHDPDEVSVVDLMAYKDTQENWPVRGGYGTLIAAHGAEVPVELNGAVTEIDWSGPDVRLTTARGTVRARRALITVSTGILSSGDIRFTPALPDWKLEAIADLPLGNHNRIALAFDRDVFGADVPPGIVIHTGEDEPLSVHVRPYGGTYVVGYTGGRFADWLERAGQQASIEHLKEKLQAAFGAEITKHASAEIVSAWRGDPWVRGAYSAARPGAAQQRARLAEPIDDRLYFAGEATSSEFFSTAHGAHLSGIARAEAVMAET